MKSTNLLTIVTNFHGHPSRASYGSDMGGLYGASQRSQYFFGSLKILLIYIYIYFSTLCFVGRFVGHQVVELPSRKLEVQNITII